MKLYSILFFAILLCSPAYALDFDIIVIGPDGKKDSKRYNTKKGQVLSTIPVPNSPFECYSNAYDARGSTGLSLTCKEKTSKKVFESMGMCNAGKKVQKFEAALNLHEDDSPNSKIYTVRIQCNPEIKFGF